MNYRDDSTRVVVIGASAGGVHAIQTLLTSLPKTFAAPIVVVQHLPADSIIDPALIFGRHYHGVIAEAIDKLPLEPSHAYFAPAGYHLLLERDFSFSLSQDEPVHYARPSIDVTFESAAENLEHRVCGVLLTGANADGARGLRDIQRAGGQTVVQDPATAEAPMMPKAAIELFTPDFVGSLSEIGPKIVELAATAKKVRRP